MKPNDDEYLESQQKKGGFKKEILIKMALSEMSVFFRVDIRLKYHCFNIFITHHIKGKIFLSSLSDLIFVLLSNGRSKS